MQRRTQVIQLSDHVKNRIKQSRPPSLNSASDEQSTWSSVFSSSNDDDEPSSPLVPQSMPRLRRDTFTIYQLKQPPESPLFFTDTNPIRMTNVSFLQQRYQQQNSPSQQQQSCLECSHRDRLLHLEHQRLSRLHDDNRKLADQLRSFISLNHLYREENHKLRDDLGTINGHLHEYQVNFDQLKRRIESDDRKITPRIKEKIPKAKEKIPDNNLKQLRHEVQVYNRILADKRQQQENAQQELMKFLS